MEEDKVFDEFVAWATLPGNLNKPFFENDSGKWSYEPFSDAFVSRSADAISDVKTSISAVKEAFFITVAVDIKRGQFVHRLEARVDLAELFGFDTVRDCAREFTRLAIELLMRSKDTVIGTGYADGTRTREAFDPLPPPVRTSRRLVSMTEAAAKLVGRPECKAIPAHRECDDDYVSDLAVKVPLTEFSSEADKED